MTAKKLLILAIAIFVFEIAILALFGGFSPDAENKEGDVLTKVGIIELVKFQMGLADFQDVAKWNLDGTPEGEPTFWSLNKGTTVMMIIIDILLIVCAYIN